MSVRWIEFAFVCFVLCLSSADAGILTHVDLSSQRMRVYEDGRLSYSWKVSTGARGYRTPLGSYRAKRLHRMWYSRKYDLSPMPHSIFFRGGYAIHGTPHVGSLGYPVSHGCIRLHPRHAQRLYRLVRAHGMRNTRIVVQR
jgi:lipoprotein-anchoring transpeptidase ErfK/SrfK